MSDDDDILEAAREGFLEEATEMLQQFEQALLDMENNPSDTEAVNSAFRAAHTVKGSAGMFGYDSVVGFTHELESLLDEMRAGAVPCSEEAIAQLLLGRDQMGTLIGLVGQALPDHVAATSAELAGRLQALRRDAAAQPAASPSSDPSVANAAEAPAALWHVSLQMGADALRNGLDPASFIRYLASVAEIDGLRTVSHGLPSLREMDAETCYLGFEARVRCAGGESTIRDVFDFLQDDCELTVLAADAGPEAFEALLAQRAALREGQREAILAAWQRLAGPQSAPFIERRAAEAVPDRRSNEPERRGGARDRRAPDESRFIRVRADKLDKLIDMIGELVIASSGAQLVASQENSPPFAEAAHRIHDLVQQARDGALGLRMVPVGDTFNRFQRVVRDVGKQLGKEVELSITGGETELDKSMVDVVADPLMHLVRNAMDHGIETAEDRVAAGKPAQGHLALNAYHESGAIIIEVSDDGRGLNRDRILAKAIERGLTSADAVLEDAEIYQFIFAAGFSTASAVTNLSGRGVGMDVVKSNIESLRGQVSIENRPGNGATFRIRLPLTLAIIDGFLTNVGGVSYVMPLEVVAECVEAPALQDGPAGSVVGHVDLRGEVLPYLDVARFYRHRSAPLGRRSLVVVKDGPHRVGLVVDRLMGEHQTVIKPLSRVFQNIRGLAGCTILGSGEVALILDIPALLEMAVGHVQHRRGALAAPPAAKAAAVEHDASAQAMAS